MSLLCFLIPMCRGPDKADFAVINGKIYTADAHDRFVEGIAAKNGIIVAAGSNEEVKKRIGSSTHVLDAEGRLVTPGFIDAHCHFASGGESLMTLVFRGIDSVKEIQAMVSAKADDLPPGTPIFGSQFDHTLFPGQKWPTKQDLDVAAPDNPVVIERVDGHSVWVNSLALEQSGIRRETPDPFGGEIVRDSKKGEPTGILKESAMELIKVRKPEASSSPEENIKRGLAHAARLGITGIQTSASLEELEIYRRLDHQGDLTLRVYGWLPYERIDEYIRKGIRQGVGDDMVKAGFLKIFVDGTISSSTALLFEPFSDEPDKTGLAQYEEEELYALVEKAHRNGYQVGMHAIGDKAVHWALNAVERTQRKHGVKGLRHRIEHVSVLHPDDVPHFKELGVIPSMQPTFCTTDLMYCERRFGQERCKGIYVWKSLIESGAPPAFGTDWPVEPLDPMRGLYSALTRKSIDFEVPEGGWFPDQCLTIIEAIKCYTRNAAFASFEENFKGSLEAGKLADMVVLSKDLFAIAPEEILKTRVLFTILGGKIVYRGERT
ncbi:MAG: amidohydrolase [Candidatus Aminicenantes bacterium]|nr:amidohydrolase [Candidatus Aminicenantes bacterium]